MDSKDTGKTIKPRLAERRTKQDPAYAGPERRKAERRTGEGAKR